jgi:hypothetical protein
MSDYEKSTEKMNKSSKASSSSLSKKSKSSGEAKKKDIKVKSYMKKSGSYYTPFKRTKQKADNKNQFSGKKK